MATTGPIYDVFVRGQGGFHTYRIPALLRLESGVFVAFCEARKFHSDHAENKIAMRLSKDGGQTWGPCKSLRMPEPTH